MQIFLPIADIPVNIFLILAMGMAVGFVSGMFGIGGGFLLTPLLIFIGITPAVAVASVAGHIAASSFSGALSYWRRRAIDPALAFVLLIGGMIGTVRRRLAVHAVALLWPARPDHRALLRRAADRRRRGDAVGKLWRDHPRPPWRATDLAPARRPQLGARPAAEAALQEIEDLSVDLSGDRHRHLHRLRRRHPRYRRRLHPDPAVDLRAARADRHRDRHLDGADAW